MTRGIKEIFRKEVKELGRDRRVLQTALIMPVFLVALFAVLMGLIQRSVLDNPVISMAVVAGGDEQLLESLRDSSELDLRIVTSYAAGVELMQAKETRLVVQFPPDIARAVASGTGEVKIAYLQSDPMSQVALGAMREAIRQANTEGVKALLRQQNLDANLAEPLQLSVEDATPKKGMSGSELVGLLPYLVVLWAFYGGMSIVSDMVAGEKERGTMETVLISAVKRGEIAVGKILALACVCLMSATMTFVGVAILGLLDLEITRSLFPEQGGLPLSAVGITGGILLSLVAFFASLLVAISAASRNIRESQTYLGGLSFVVLLPAVFSQVIGFTGAEKELWVAFTPILNSAMGLRAALAGEGLTPAAGGAFATNLALALLCTIIAVRLFRREGMVLRV